LALDVQIDGDAGIATCCWITWAYSGISRYFSVVNFTVKPSGCPASARSCLAWAISR